MGSPYQDGQLYRPRYLQDRYSDEWRFQCGHAAGLRGGRGVRQHLYNKNTNHYCDFQRLVK